MVARQALRFQTRPLLASTIVIFVIVWVLLVCRPVPQRVVDEQLLRVKSPLAYKHIHSFRGKGGGKNNVHYTLLSLADRQFAIMATLY